MLAELMRMQKTVAVAGTHGKTTTTSMIAALLDAGGIDPTVINGGIINRYGSNARLGKSDWWVIEADESDGSFLRLDGTIAVVTNIDPEHLEHYGSFDAVKDAFVEFIENVPFYGLARDVRRPSRSAGRARAGSATGASSPTAFRRWPTCAPTMSQPDAGGSRFDALVLRQGRRAAHDRRRPCADPGPPQCPECAGRDRRRARAWHRRRSDRRRVRKVRGVKRRFTSVGEVDGAVVIDDYAHHPTEIRAVLVGRARRAPEGRVIAVMQPHRYTRLEALMEEFQNAFNDADVVFVTPVYAAGEEPIEGVDSAALAEGLRAHGHRMARDRRRPRRALRGAARSCRRGRHDHLHGRGRHHQMGGGARRRHLRGAGQRK